MNIRQTPEYRAALSWVRRGARANRGVVFTAVMGDRRLDCTVDKRGRQHIKTWYGSSQ